VASTGVQKRQYLAFEELFSNKGRDRNLKLSGLKVKKWANILNLQGTTTTLFHGAHFVA
jgi:hypothetical protein